MNYFLNELEIHQEDSIDFEYSDGFEQGREIIEMILSEQFFERSTEGYSFAFLPFMENN